MPWRDFEREGLSTYIYGPGHPWYLRKSLGQRIKIVILYITPNLEYNVNR
ncbi:hypothetical protein SAMN05660235_00564 [Sporolituus thermophilus DSM 23256]|uniref:Uncharacterized protein n=1 Tax=Sporolituus thermophilus DSM 23256 TaxID=1123285 RepID=A0A1G7IP02_9FIRM|nr:hypothetical protein SAMN05660235_00564 [Sporolituus thermophilus DSM 23256]